MKEKTKNIFIRVIILLIILISFNIYVYSQDPNYILGRETNPNLKFDNNSPLSLDIDDIVFVKRDDDYFDIFIKDKPEIKSVLITSIPIDENYVTTEIYGLRATEYNPVNGDEPRIFDGRFLSKDGKKYFLVDSTIEPALPFFESAYHILVPPLLEYGYKEEGQFGTIRLVENIKINIRTYSEKYADNKAEFIDNIFIIKFDDSPPMITLLGYEEMNEKYIKIFLRYEDDKDFDLFFIKECFPKNERFKILDIANNIVPEDLKAQLKGLTNNPDGSINIRIDIDIERPVEEKRTLVVTAIDKSGNSALTPIRFTIKPRKKKEEPEEEVIEDKSKYDSKTISSFKDIADKTGGENLISESPENLPEKIIEAIKKATEDYNGDDLDLIFAIDSTGSMSDDIDYVKLELKSILRTITDQFQFANLGMVLYKDRKDDFITKTYPFTQDIERFKMQIDSIRTSGGGDKPEAIIDALYSAVTEFEWTAGKRVIILIGDAPPHNESVEGEPKTLDDIYNAATDIDVTIQIYTITVPANWYTSSDLNLD